MKPTITAAFAHAARQLQRPPADAETAVMEWFALATPKSVPRPILGKIIESTDGLIRVLTADGVAAIVVDGRLRYFLPTRVVLPGRDLEMSVALRALETWLGDPTARVPGAEDFEALRAAAGRRA